MAVEKKTETPALVGKFWPAYRDRALLLVGGTQLFIYAIAILAMFTFHVSINPLEWLAIIAVGIASIIVICVVVLGVLRPLGDLSRALVHISGEPTGLTAPNLNDDYYAKSHLRPLLQLIYELAASQPESTEQHAKANASKPAKQTLDVPSLLNNTSTGIIMLNSDHEVIYTNQSAPVHTDQHGTTKIDLLFDASDSIDTWLAERGDHDIRAEHVWRRIADKLPGEEGRRLFDIYVSYQKGSEAETILTLFDQTEQYGPEDEDLDFIAFAAHELRGPITVIRGYLDTLNDELQQALSGDQKELFSRLIVSANRLSGYINNILNASRYDRRHLKVHLNELPVSDIYESISDDMLLRAQSQQRVLNVNIPTNLPTVAADSDSIGEVISNLIDNAIKYSNPGGTIEVSAILAGDFVEVSVRDHGIGMPSNVLANLFHKFYRSHRSREAVAGSGIGLYITKAIVESHGGTISVHSVEGEGSTFTFTLPVYASVAAKLKAAGGDNDMLIERSSSGWIKNHGAFRG
ncbi:TPA: hypothetical protein DIV49_00425 [Candidatus Saccharibacteria bacterium]|nr:hypothetical protein [Candidatus Saccharibacteria bacterium]HRJ91063.1 HAMP domain-containing sensor histidine kinase [Candidatus Saccharibacteria bacterium]